MGLALLSSVRNGYGRVAPLRLGGRGLVADAEVFEELDSLLVVDLGVPRRHTERRVAE